jgi:hypothetical protein
MAGIGVPPHIADKILNHEAKTIAGVAAVYQRHDFMRNAKMRLSGGDITSPRL